VARALGGVHGRIVLRRGLRVRRRPRAPRATGYLATVIAPWLRATAPPVVRRELLTAAARLTYLCGFTHYDDELHSASSTKAARSFDAFQTFGAGVGACPSL